jgi:hypothetical protein
MTKKNLLTASAAGLIALVSALTALTGCAPAASTTATVAETTPPAPAPTPAAPAPATVAQDDYDYYPGYEVYYSRNQHEYVYRDGNSWVRRPQPRGITVEALFASPSVRVDFHDSPERHHNEVVRNYPRNWKRPDDKRDDRKKN